MHTELRAFTSFLIEVTRSTTYNLSGDVRWLFRVMEFVYCNKAWNTLRSTVCALLQFSKSVVKAINTNSKLEFDSKVFAPARKGSRLPRFLKVLTSSFLTHEGTLKDRYDLRAMSIFFEGLAMLKRIKDKNLAAITRLEAWRELKESQLTERRLNPCIVEDLRIITHEFLSETLSKDITYGSLGPGIFLNTPEENRREPHYVPSLTTFDPEGKIFDHHSLEWRPVPDLVTRFLERCHMQRFGNKSGPSISAPRACNGGFRVSSSARLHRTDRVTTVPKNVEVDRAINYTELYLAQIGACLRETLLTTVRRQGFSRIINIHDQTLSHDVLNKFPNLVSLYDVRMGSQCLSLNLIREIFPTWISELIDFCVPKSLVFTNDRDGLEYVDVTTAQQGNHWCVAVLSIVLGLVQTVLCQYYYDSLEYSTKHIVSTVSSLRKVQGSSYVRNLTPAIVREYIKYIRSEDLSRQVGDDIVTTVERGMILEHIFPSLGMQLNLSKCSRPGDIFRETCGCFRLYFNGGSIPIYPFRVPAHENRYIQLSAMSNYLQRAKSSLNINLLTDALSIFDKRLTNLAYSDSFIGSPSGVAGRTEWYCIATKSKGHKEIPVPDEHCYAFGLSGLDDHTHPAFAETCKSVPLQCSVEPMARLKKITKQRAEVRWIHRLVSTGQPADSWVDGVSDSVSVRLSFG